jgi:RNA polymerase sigma factor (sigma-70 family)
MADAPLSAVAAAARGEAQAWNELVAHYTPLVISVIRRYRLSDEDAADVNQTLWLRLVEHLDSIREPRALPLWIITTTRNECLQVLRSRRRTRTVDPATGLDDTEDPAGTDLAEDLLQAERHQVLRGSRSSRPLAGTCWPCSPPTRRRPTRRSPTGSACPAAASGPPGRGAWRSCASRPRWCPSFRRSGTATAGEVGGMAWQRWDDDEHLMAELGEALSAPGTVKESYLDAGRGAFTWRTVDEDLALAALAYDSALDEELVGRARSGDTSRALVFQGTDVSVEVHVSGEGLVGQLVPPATADVAVYTAAGVFARASADEIGCFTLAPPPPGPVRLECRTAEAALVTDWFCL